jgi:hypothetical protein
MNITAVQLERVSEASSAPATLRTGAKSARYSAGICLYVQANCVPGSRGGRFFFIETPQAIVWQHFIAPVFLSLSLSLSLHLCVKKLK